MATEPAGAAPGFWAHKPFWCQPWSILATGVLVVSASWLLLHRWWISLPLALAVLAWWLLFLLLVPAAWRAEQQAAGPAGSDPAAQASAARPQR